MTNHLQDHVQGLISVDVGHLWTLKTSESNNLDQNTAEHNKLMLQYSDVFQQLQTQLRDNLSPMTLSLQETAIIPRIKTLAEKIKAKYQNVLLLGIGGSALGAKAVLQFLRGPHYNLETKGHPRLFILDNIDPVVTRQVADLVDMSKTAIIYVSKSGSTPETAAQFVYFYQKYQAAGGNVEDIVICCDPGDNGINRIAQELKCHLIHIPKNLGGRYSVLSSVGFLPAEIAGISGEKLLAGAAAMHQYIINTAPENNALLALGAKLHHLSQQGQSIHVLFNYSNLLDQFGLWFVQLWAESLGKKFSLSGDVVHAGTTPMTSIGATDQHSILQLYKEGPTDKVFGFITIDEVEDEITLAGAFPKEKEYAYFAGASMQKQLQIELLSTEMSLVQAGRPCYRITLKNQSEQCLGALFYFYQALTVFTAALWHINPYDQPGVEDGKNITYTLMGREDYSNRMDEFQRAVNQYNQERKIYVISG